jgi:uncharacterized protein
MSPVSRLPRPDRVRQAVRLVLGMTMLGVGVAGMLAADLGVAPFDLLGAGIVARLGVGFTVAGLIIHVTATAVALLAGRRPRAVPTFAVLGIGPVIDVALPGLRTLATLVPAPLMLLAGLSLFAFGIALYLAAGIGEAPIEAVQLVLETRAGLPRAAARMLIDVTGGTIGVLLGGPIGVGTAVLALATGPAVAGASRVLAGRGVWPAPPIMEPVGAPAAAEV